MKKILLLSINMVFSIVVFSQTYCLEMSKVSEENPATGKIKFKFTLTNYTGNQGDYLIDLTVISGVTPTTPVSIFNTSPVPDPAPAPFVLGEIEFTKDGSLNPVEFSVANTSEVYNNSGVLINNNASCNELSVPVTAPLPLEWLSFKANLLNIDGKSKVALEWSTASEKDVKDFTVERSVDAKTFEQVGEKVAAYNTSDKHSYSAMDEKPFFGISYYRIRQTDYDGKTTVTKIQSVSLSEQKSVGKFVIYPNPVGRGTPLSILTDVQGEYTFKVMDIAGRIVYIAKLQGGNTELKNMSLKAGTYIYEVLWSSQHINGKILVAE